MPGKRSRKGSGDPFLDAAGEWAWSMRTDLGYGLQVSLYPLDAHGNWDVHVRALHLVDGQPRGVYASVKGRWPTAQVQTLSAYVYQLVSELEREISVPALLRMPHAQA